MAKNHVFTKDERERGSSRGGVVTRDHYGAEHYIQLGRKGGKARAYRSTIKGVTPTLIIIDDPLKETP